MPSKPHKPCGRCGKASVKGGLCRDHLGAYEAQRGTAHERGYDSKHEELFRKPVLASNDGRCVLCGRPALHADHYPLSRKELVAAGMDPNDPANGRPLCASCHSSHTATTQSNWGNNE